jgi:hypothetical protein
MKAITAEMSRQKRVDWFAKLSQTLGLSLDPKLNLLAEAKIAEECFRDVRDATWRYIRACLGNPADNPSEETLLAWLEKEDPSNKTPNGILLPKAEFQREFNDLHRAFASWIASLGIDDLIYQVFCPLTVRLVRGKVLPQVEARPFASNKLHTDIWAGDPADTVAMLLPIAGDIERTTIEFFHPPNDFEEKYLKVFDGYEAAKELVGRCLPYPAAPRLGYAYFFDALILHRTVRRQGGARISIDCRIRRSMPDQDRQHFISLSDPDRLKLYLNRQEWSEFGRTKFMRFKDLNSDAAKGTFLPKPYNEQLYDLVDQL